MPPTKDRLDVIDARLDRIELALRLKPPKPKSPFGLLRAEIWGKIKTHKTSIITALTISLTISGWFISGWFKYHLDHRDDSFNQAIDARIDGKQQDLSKRLDEISKTVTKTETTLMTLAPIIQDLVRHEMDKQALLPKSEFQSSLPQLKSIIQVAKSENVSVPPKTIQGIQQKLLTSDHNAVDYWPAVATFITYRSALGVQKFGTYSGLPQCTAAEPQATLAEPVSAGQNTIKITPAIYHDCQVVLDSTTTSEAVGRTLSWDNVVFQHCVVIYNGGSITFRPVKIGNEAKINGHLIFENCLFIFATPSALPIDGQGLLRTLLASSTSKANFTLTPG